MELKKEYLKAMASPLSSSEETNGEGTSLEATDEISGPEAVARADLTSDQMKKD